MNAITLHKFSEKAQTLLAERARGATVEDEAAAIVEQALAETRSPNWRQQSADRIAAMTPRGVEQTNSTAIVRAERDRER